MPSLEPLFRRDHGGRLLLLDSAQVRMIKSQQRARDWSAARSPAMVRKDAEKRLIQAGGDIGNPKHLLGCFELQIGQFRGMTFKWILENSPGYAGYLLSRMMEDATNTTDSRWVNKMAFKKYVELWPEGKEIVMMKKRQLALKEDKAPTTKPDEPDDMSDGELLETTQEIEKKIAGCLTAESVPVISSREQFVPTVKAQRKALLPDVDVTVRKSMPATASSKNPPITLRKPTPEPATPEDLCLPERWKTTLPKEDRQWVSKALFRWNKGRAGLVPEAINQLSWYPPQPTLAVHSIPGVNRYFARPLFLWFPRKQWKVKIYCPNPDCEKQELASAGINQKVQQVMDIDGYYNLACDNLNFQTDHHYPDTDGL